MIKIESIAVHGFEEAVMAVRNPYDSWDKSDSRTDIGSLGDVHFILGKNDLELMTKLANAGNDHGKFLRAIVVYMDITAPLYWWKEYDTYKVGTVANSCSTMHTITKYEFNRDMFSCEDLGDMDGSIRVMDYTIGHLNFLRDVYLSAKSQETPTDNELAEEVWREIIQLLPSSFNQKRSVLLNYAVLKNIYKSRHDHKLSEWREFCEYAKNNLPYSYMFTGEKGNNK